MPHLHQRSIFVYSVLAFFAFALAGCGSKESKWLGTYSSSQGQLQLKGEHKGTITMNGSSSDVTWEMVSDDKITVHAPFPIQMFKTSSGLRDEEGADWKKK